MALNYTNPPSGETIATDFLVTDHVQLVKLTVGSTDTDTERVGSASPLPIEIVGSTKLRTYIATSTRWPNSYDITTGGQTLVTLSNRNGSAGTVIIKLRRMSLSAVASVSGNMMLTLSRDFSSAPLTDGSGTVVSSMDITDSAPQGIMRQLAAPLWGDTIWSSLYRSDGQNDALAGFGQYSDFIAKPLTLRRGDFVALTAQSDKTIGLLWALTMTWTEEPE